MGYFTDKLVDRDQKARATRLSFGEELVALGEKDSRVVALDADLSKSTYTMLFGAKFPDRFFNMGIAEANMIGVAAGFARSGMIPFAASFGCFLTGRFDQIRMSVSFSQTKTRLVGTHAGVGIGEDGHSQMALEDLALMRVLPNMIVYQPADDWDTRQFMKWSLDYEGPCYMRLTRQNLPALKRRSDEIFEMGQWKVLTPLGPNPDIVLIASGGVVGPAIEAADMLASIVSPDKICVVNANWIQPLDEKFLLEMLTSKPKLIVTVEDHYKVGGLGGAVSEYISSFSVPSRLFRIGVTGFGQSGTPEANYAHYGLNATGIFEKIKIELNV